MGAAITPRDVVPNYTHPSVAKYNAATSVVELLPESDPSHRLGVMFYNRSTANLFLGFGTTPTTSTDFSVVIPSNGYYELPYFGARQANVINGIWDAANGYVMVTEFN